MLYGNRFLTEDAPATDFPASGVSALDAMRLVGEELAGEGDPQSMATLNRYTERLARALAHVINILDPEVIVLGGGMSNIDTLYDRVPRLWGDWVFSDRVDTRLVRNKHGDSSGVRGAAWLWPR